MILNHKYIRFEDKYIDEDIEKVIVYIYNKLK